MKPPRKLVRIHTHATKYKYYHPNLATPEEKKEARRLMDAQDTLAELRKAWRK